MSCWSSASGAFRTAIGSSAKGDSTLIAADAAMRGVV
jgi:hypothetical protein